LGKWFDLSAYPATTGFAIYFRDVTERKRNERALSQFAAIVDSSDDAILSVDLSGSVLTWNSAAERIFGYSAEEMIGSPISLLASPDRPQEQLWILEKIKRGESLQHFETIRVRKDGKPIHVSLTVSAIRDSTGAIVATSRVEQDITQVKAIEDQLRHTAKLESLGVLAGGIAHDFNNLLVGILGNVCLVSDLLPPSSPLRAPLDDVIKAGERAADLTQQMLAYSGRGQFNIQAVDLSALTREIQSLAQSSIPRTVQMELDLARGLPAVTADVAQMRQLIMNIVINAGKAIGDSPGRVTITTGVQEVDEHYIGAEKVSPGRYVFLEVQDNGCGMDEATMARIFDPFFTTKFTGRGLGLSAALGIVRGHKGYIHVGSSPGRGTTIRVLLPAAEERAQPVEVREVPQELARSGLILVVDDEEIVRRTAALALEFRGFSILDRSAADTVPTSDRG
jgi:PAS domain S-box-containing protein